MSPTFFMHLPVPSSSPQLPQDRCLIKASNLDGQKDPRSPFPVYPAPPAQALRMHCCEAGAVPHFASR